MNINERAYVNTNPEPRDRPKLTPITPKPMHNNDPHQHKAGLMAQAFANTKTDGMKSGFFEPTTPK